MKIKTVLQLVIISHSIPYGELNKITEELSDSHGTDIECAKLKGHYMITFVNRNIPIEDIVKITNTLTKKYSKDSVYLRTSLQFISEKEIEELEKRSIFRVATDKNIQVISNTSKRCKAYNNDVIIGTYINQKDDSDEISFRTLILLYRRHPVTGKIKVDYSVYNHCNPEVGFYKSPVHKKIRSNGLYRMQSKVLNCIRQNVKELTDQYNGVELSCVETDKHFFTLDISKYSYTNSGDLT